MLGGLRVLLCGRIVGEPKLEIRETKFNSNFGNLVRPSVAITAAETRFHSRSRTKTTKSTLASSTYTRISLSLV